jgi:hypothetical protein
VIERQNDFAQHTIPSEHLMKRSIRYAIAGVLLLTGSAIAYYNWPVPDKFDEAVVSLDASPTEIVRFTATRSYTRLPVDEQMKYLMVWQATPDAEKQRVLAELSKEPMVLDLSSANSKQTSQLHLSRQYFALPKEVRNQAMDEIIDAEQSSIKQILANMKKAGLDPNKTGGGLGNQKLRKLLIESTPAAVRMELAAFADAKRERMKERGISPG